MPVTKKHFIKAMHGIEVHNLQVRHFEAHPDTVLEGFLTDSESEIELEQRAPAPGYERFKLYRNAAVPVDVVRAVSRYNRWFDSFESETKQVEVWRCRSSVAEISLVGVKFI